MENFFQLPNEVMDSQALSLHQKIVLIYLYRLGNNGSSIYPSYSTIAKHCGIGRTKTIATISELKTLGIVTVTRRKKSGNYNNTNLYKINSDALKYLELKMQRGKKETPLLVPSPHQIQGGVQYELGGAQGEPPVVQEVYPMNNSFNKEQVIKNYSVGSTKSVSPNFDSRRNLTFEEYKNLFGAQKDPESLRAIDYFIEYRKSFFGEHKKMRKASWDAAVTEVLNLYSLQRSRPELDSVCDFKLFEFIVECYFNKTDKFDKPCDYSISHFNSPNIKGIIYHEELF